MGLSGGSGFGVCARSGYNRGHPAPTAAGRVCGKGPPNVGVPPLVSGVSFYLGEVGFSRDFRCYLFPPLSLLWTFDKARRPRKRGSEKGREMLYIVVRRSRTTIYNISSPFSSFHLEAIGLCPKSRTGLSDKTSFSVGDRTGKMGRAGCFWAPGFARRPKTSCLLLLSSIGVLADVDLSVNQVQDFYIRPGGVVDHGAHEVFVGRTGSTQSMVQH